MSIPELCFVFITIAILILVVHLVKTLKNVNRTLDHVHDITKSVNDKTKAVDDFLEKTKEWEGILKYAKIGFEVVKNLKKDKNTEKHEEKDEPIIEKK